MITENSTPKTQARAFSFFAFASNLGIFLGPLVGTSLIPISVVIQINAPQGVDSQVPLSNTLNSSEEASF
jgi:hypothetical protein